MSYFMRFLLPHEILEVFGEVVGLLKKKKGKKQGEEKKGIKNVKVFFRRTGNTVDNSLGHVFHALTTAGSFGCSVSGLTRCPPHYPPSVGKLPFQHSEDSSLAVGAASACFTTA